LSKRTLQMPMAAGMKASDVVPNSSSSCGIRHSSRPSVHVSQNRLSSTEGSCGRFPDSGYMYVGRWGQWLRLLVVSSAQAESESAANCWRRSNRARRSTQRSLAMCAGMFTRWMSKAANCCGGSPRRRPPRCRALVGAPSVMLQSGVFTSRSPRIGGRSESTQSRIIRAGSGRGIISRWMRDRKADLEDLQRVEDKRPIVRLKKTPDKGCLGAFPALVSLEHADAGSESPA